MWGLGDNWATKGSHSLKHASLVLWLFLLLLTHPLLFITLFNNIFEHLLSAEDSAVSKAHTALPLKVQFADHHHLS